MHYQIYLPGKRTGDGEHLEAAGLGHLRGTEEYFPTHSGPDGKGGMIVAFRNGDHAGLFGFSPDEQEWIEGDGYWCGFWKNSAPTPKELQKPPGVPGMEVVLGDGQRWIVPVAEMLPQDIIFEDGSPQAVVKKQYAEFWNESTRWIGWFMEVDVDKAVPETFMPELLEYVLKALSLNYRIVPELVTHVRLLDFQTIQRCVAATMHKPTINDVELEKKTAELVGIPVT